MILTILYEDNHLIAVDKPLGLPTQADASGDADLLTLVKEYIKEKYRKPGAVYIGMAHRLDRPVGGVVVFARTSKSASRLSEQLRDGRFRKAYLAVLRGAPAAPQGELEHWLVKDGAANFVSVVPAGTPGAKRARLAYHTLAARDGLTLVAVELLTGRSHQIRVQFAAVGAPVVGDEKYGPKSGAALSALALHAASVSLEHPVRRAPLRISAMPPSGDPWDRFDPNLFPLNELIS